MKTIIATMIALFTLNTAWAGQVATLNSFAANSPAVAADVNANFTSLATAVNDNYAQLSTTATTVNDMYGQVASMTAIVNDAYAQVTTNTTTLAAHASNITANGNSIGTNAANVIAHGTRLTTIETQAANLATGCVVGKSIQSIAANGTVTCGNAGPLAFGTITSTGAVSKVTPNVASIWDPVLSRYEITITAENYFWLDYVTHITPMGSTAILCSSNSIGGKLLVSCSDIAGTAVQTAFGFTTYKP